MSLTEAAAREELLDVISEGSLRYLATVPTVAEPDAFIVLDIDSAGTPDAWTIPVRIYTPMVTPADGQTRALEYTDEYEALFRDAGYLTTWSRSYISEINAIVSEFRVTMYRSDF